MSQNPLDEEHALDLGLGFGDEIESQNNDNYNAVFNSGGDEGEFEAKRNNDHLCLEDHKKSINELEDVVEERLNEIDESELAANNSERNHSEMNASSELALYLEFEDDNVDDDLLYSGGLAVPVDDMYAPEFRALLFENHSEMNGNPPAAKSIVENLPLVELTEEELKAKNVACAICKIDIMLEEKVRRLPCSHCYHGDCIIPWLNMRNTCPVCLFELPTDDADYEESKIHRAARGLLELAAAHI